MNDPNGMKEIMADDLNYKSVIQEDFTDELEEFDSSLPPVVQDEDAAQTALARLVFRDKEIARIEARRDFIKNQADEWANQQIEKIEVQKQHFLLPLESFMKSINKSNPKIKSLKFPYGTIGVRQTPQKIEIDDDFKPEEHADDPFVSAKVTYSVNKANIKKVMKNTGELPEYASVVPGEIKFYFKGNE